MNSNLYTVAIAEAKKISYCVVAGFGCAQSMPIGIPGGLPRGSISSLSQSPPSPYGSFSHTLWYYIFAGFGCAQSVPIGIPGGLPRGSISSLSTSPPSPYGSFSHTLLTLHQKQQESGDQVNVSKLSVLEIWCVTLLSHSTIFQQNSGISWTESG